MEFVYCLTVAYSSKHSTDHTQILRANHIEDSLSNRPSILQIFLLLDRLALGQDDTVDPMCSVATTILWPKAQG